MTTNQAAKALSDKATGKTVSVRRVQAMIASGRLKARKEGRDWFIEEADLEAVRDRKPGRPAKPANS